MEETILAIINTVGFPAAVCVCLIIYMYKLTKTHAEEISKLAEIIDISLANNTTAIKELTIAIAKDRDKEDEKKE